MTNNYQFQSPHFRNLGYLTWFILLLFSLTFYQERAIFMDGAFQLFELINNKVPAIYHYRLTNPLTQVLPLVTIYLKLPLKWVMIAYSVNFILFHLFIYHLIIRYLRNDFLGWTQIFFFTLLVFDSFYFLPPEFYQGTSLMLLFFAIILKYPKLEKSWNLPVLALLLICIVFDHKLIAIFFTFLWSFFFLQNQELRHKKYFSLFVFLVVLFVIHGKFFTDWYDSAKQADFWRYLNQFWGTYHEIPAHKKFFAKIGKFYYFYPIFLMIGVMGYCLGIFARLVAKGGILNLHVSESTKVLFRRLGGEIQYPFLKLFLLISFNIGYLFLIHIGDPYTTIRFYSEVNYIGLSIFICIPFLFDFIPYLIKKRMFEKGILALFIGIICIRLVTIFNNHEHFENRLNWFSELMEKGEEMGTNRLLINEKDYPTETYIMSWPSPQESALISALKDKNNVKTILIYNNEKQFEEYLTEDNIFLSSFKRMEMEDLNSDYFNMNKRKYMKLK